MVNNLEKIWNGGAARSSEEDLSDIMTSEDIQKDELILYYELISLLSYHVQIYKASLIERHDSIAIIGSLIELLEKKQPIDPQFEDVHSYVEYAVGQIAGKAYENLRIFLSRNEQIHTDIRLFQIDHLLKISKLLNEGARRACDKGSASSGVIPGYTHYRQAMPVATGTYYDYISGTMVDLSSDAINLASSLIERSPLGYGSGLGSLSPVDFQKVGEPVGFKGSFENPLFGSSRRGMDDLEVNFFIEKSMVSLSRIAQDMIVYSADKHGFITLPDAFTTGSSLMANKRNPDFLEMMQGYASISISNHVMAAAMLENKSSGYHREFQISKDKTMDFILLFEKLMKHFNSFLSNVNIKGAQDENYMENSIYATGETLRLFKSGKSWKESYRAAGDKVNKGEKLHEYLPEPYKSVSEEIIIKQLSKINEIEAQINAKRQHLFEEANSLVQ